MNQQMEKPDSADILACDSCGTLTHIDLLDAKPDDPTRPDASDWNRLECRSCYGPNWVPALETQWPLRGRVTRAIQRTLKRFGLPYGHYVSGAF